MTQGLGWELYPWPVSLERLLAGNSRDMASTPQPVRPIATAQRSSATLYNKTGSTGGFGAYVAFVPEERKAVIILANRNYPNAARIEAAVEIFKGLADIATE